MLDRRFASSEGEQALIFEVGKEVKYPGIEKVLVHERAHFALWSVTGQDYQPATRLLDEGWARLIEDLSESDIPSEIEKTRKYISQGIDNEPDAYTRCLDLSSPISQEESASLNGAEYVCGKGLLLWIFETYGKESMVQLLKGSPSVSKRTPEGKIELSDQSAIDMLDGDLEATEENLRKVNAREAQRTINSFREVTGLDTKDEILSAFEAWLRN